MCLSKSKFVFHNPSYLQQDNSKPVHMFYTYSEELIRSLAIDRNLVVALNEQVSLLAEAELLGGRLCREFPILFQVMSSWRGLVCVSEERNKLLSAASSCFKTYESVRPILEQLEKDYAVSYALF